MMKQAVAGVVPSELGEVTIMTIWPSLAAMAGGRWWGRLYAMNAGITIAGVPITVGRLIALFSIPFILPPYFLMLLPCFIWLPKIGRFPGIYVPNPWCRRYRLTNRNVKIEHGTSGAVERAVSLDEFDTIDIDVLPGQKWYQAGDLIFRLGNLETFRLEGVPRPDAFRQVCLKAHRSHVAVAQARSRERAAG